MAAKKDNITIIGEGITESFFLDSLKEKYLSNINVRPKIPTHATLKELGTLIDKAKGDGAAKIYCLIDMDNKKEGKDKENYEQFKQKYSKSNKKSKNKNNTQVLFIESERCTELFFLYYFKYTTQQFYSSDDLIKELNRSNKELDYQKHKDFFKKHSLNSYFEIKGGKLSSAINHAEKSFTSAFKDNRNYTYTAIGSMLNDILDPKKI